MDIDRLKLVLVRIDQEGARKNQHASSVASMDALLEAVRDWFAMVVESGVHPGQLAEAERGLMAAALGCRPGELDARWNSL